MSKLTPAQKSELGLLSTGIAPVAQLPVKKSAEGSLNQTERELLAVLRSAHGGDQIGVQRIRLTLAHRCTYTPDFDSVSLDGRLILWECKGGFKWEDSWVKLKTAATMFPAIRFIFAQKKNRAWAFTEIPKA